MFSALICFFLACSSLRLSPGSTAATSRQILKYLFLSISRFHASANSLTGTFPNQRQVNRLAKMPDLGDLINSNMTWLCLYYPLFIVCWSWACFFTVFTQFCDIAEEGSHAAQAAPSSSIEKDAIKHRPYLTLPLPVGIVFAPFEIYLFHRAANLAAVHATQGMWEKLFSGMYMLAWSYFFISFLAITVDSVKRMQDNWPE